MKRRVGLNATFLGRMAKASHLSFFLEPGAKETSHATKYKKTYPVNPSGPVPSLPHDSYKADSYLFLQVSAGKKPGLDGHLY